MLRIRNPRQFSLPLLDNRQRQHTQIHTNNAPPDTLPLPLARPPWPITAMTLTQ